MKYEACHVHAVHLAGITIDSIVERRLLLRLLAAYLTAVTSCVVIATGMLMRLVTLHPPLMSLPWLPKWIKHDRWLNA